MRRQAVAVLLGFSSPLFRLSVVFFPRSWFGLLFKLPLLANDFSDTFESLFAIGTDGLLF